MQHQMKGGIKRRSFGEIAPLKNRRSWKRFIRGRAALYLTSKPGEQFSSVRPVCFPHCCSLTARRAAGKHGDGLGGGARRKRGGSRAHDRAKTAAPALSHAARPSPGLACGTASNPRPSYRCVSRWRTLQRCQKRKQVESAATPVPAASCSSPVRGADQWEASTGGMLPVNMCGPPPMAASDWPALHTPPRDPNRFPFSFTGGGGVSASRGRTLHSKQ